MGKVNEEEAPGLTAGTLIDGRYKVVRCIGQGGNGLVHEVEHVLTGRRLALKSLLDESGYGRLEQEARAASLMKNPHSVKITDMGTTPSAGPYIVMELLEGQSLRALLEETGQLPLELTVNIALQVCECLAEAHAHGIIHRDLKPDNVFLCAGAAPGSHDVKVLDFGVVKIANDGPIPNSSLTRTGSTVGTPFYMSLEQLRNSSNVDARSDIYALAVVLYECLSGSKPFQAETIGDLVYALCSGPPTHLSRLRPDLPAEVCEVIMRALSINREQRQNTMIELATQLLSHGDPNMGQWLKERRATGAAALGRSGPPAASAIAPPNPTPSSVKGIPGAGLDARPLAPVGAPIEMAPALAAPGYSPKPPGAGIAGPPRPGGPPAQPPGMPAPAAALSTPLPGPAAAPPAPIARPAGPIALPPRPRSSPPGPQRQKESAPANLGAERPAASAALPWERVAAEATSDDDDENEGRTGRREPPSPSPSPRLGLSNDRDTPTEMYVKGAHGVELPHLDRDDEDRDIPTGDLDGPAPGPPATAPLPMPMGRGTMRMVPGSMEFLAPPPYPLGGGPTEPGDGLTPFERERNGPDVTSALEMQGLPYAQTALAPVEIQALSEPQGPGPGSHLSTSTASASYPAHSSLEGDRPPWQVTLDTWLFGVGDFGERNGKRLLVAFRAASPRQQIAIVVVGASLIAILIVLTLYVIIA